MAVAQHPIGEDEIRSAMESVLASDAFNRSPQLSRLLKYLCNSFLDRATDRLTEHVIGAEVLGRNSEFDPAQDSAVRVEMHRLRRRLRDYYQSEGAADRVRIQVPAGRYTPVFSWAHDEEPEVFITEQVIEARPEPPRIVASAPAAPAALRWRMTWRWAACLALVVAALAYSLARRAPIPAPAGIAHAESAALTPVLPAASSSDVHRISCGRTRPWTDRLGQMWSADADFQGGQRYEIQPRSYIAGTLEPHLFESARTGTFSYRIPLPRRTYELRLYFIEPVFSPEADPGGEANRIFNIDVNGERVLDHFDIISDAGGPWIADVRVFKDIVPGSDGAVHLDVSSIFGTPLLNAIEFVPARPHILNPIRILPQDSFYTDSAGNLWTPDNYSISGRFATHVGKVPNTRDQDIFSHERYGHFRYAIPVARGSYSLYLYMSEKYFGPGNAGGGGLGTRIFDVYCNGATLLRNLDLLKQAAPNYGIVRAFRHLTPNAQGKLDISFVPVHDYASLYGIEVLDEDGPDVSSSARTVAPADGGL